MNSHKHKKGQPQDHANANKIVDEIVKKITKDNLTFEEKFRLLNKLSENFAKMGRKHQELSKSKFRKYYDLFIIAKEKMENQKDIKKKREEYEKVLLRAFILAKYDVNRKQLSKGSLDSLFEKIIEKIKNENDEKFVEVFEKLTLFLESVAAYLTKD